MENTKQNIFPLWARKTLVVILFFLISSTVYVAINDYNAGKAGAILMTKIDGRIPFNPRWVWPYYYYYLLLLFPIFLVKDRTELRKGILTFALTGLITSAFFFLWPTRMIRPAIIGDTLAIRLVRGIYERDHPYNCFPSQHVAYSFTAAFVALRNHKTLGILGLIAALTIAASTVLIKQHWFVDIPSGIAVAALAFFVIYRPSMFVKSPTVN